MSNEITGFLKELLTPETGTKKNGEAWNKQTFVIETEGQYPKLIAFTAWKDSICKAIAQQTIGSSITVGFDAESREYNGRYYTELKCFKFNVNAAASQPATPMTDKLMSEEMDSKEEEQDKLPF